MTKELNMENVETSKPMEKSETAKFDIRKPYKWEPETAFPLSGMEFSILYNNLMSFMTGQITPASILKLADCFSVVQNKLIEAVNDGRAYEYQQQQESESIT